ncbi:hypothetical protein DINM_007014 [Dirofilaria immitis]|nr:hypothetical protein [Dirofilaria immitis]
MDSSIENCRTTSETGLLVSDAKLCKSNYWFQIPHAFPASILLHFGATILLHFRPLFCCISGYYPTAFPANCTFAYHSGYLSVRHSSLVAMSVRYGKGQRPRKPVSITPSQFISNSGGIGWLVAMCSGHYLSDGYMLMYDAYNVHHM